MVSRTIRILGLDPGLQHTGWGLIESDGYRLRFVAEGVISTSARDALGDRLLILHQGLAEAFANLQPDEAAVENTYVARNPESAVRPEISPDQAWLAALQRLGSGYLA